MVGLEFRRVIFFFQAEDGIRDHCVTGSSDVCSSDLSYVFSKLRYNGLASNGTMCFGQFLLSPSSNTGYQSWQGTMNQIFVGGCSNICAEVADQKLGQAYRRSEERRRERV